MPRTPYEYFPAESTTGFNQFNQLRSLTWTEMINDQHRPHFPERMTAFDPTGPSTWAEAINEASDQYRLDIFMNSIFYSNRNDWNVTYADSTVSLRNPLWGEIVLTYHATPQKKISTVITPYETEQRLTDVRRAPVRHQHETWVAGKIISLFPEALPFLMELENQGTNENTPPEEETQEGGGSFLAQETTLQPERPSYFYEIYSVVIRVISGTLGIIPNAIDLDVTPRKFNADALDMISIVMELEEHFDIRMKNLDEDVLIEDIVNHIIEVKYGIKRMRITLETP